MVWFNRGRHITFNTSAAALGEAPYAPLLDVMKIALMRAAYTIDIDTHEQFDDISANEIVATGYTTRGFVLASKTMTRDDTNDRTEFDAADQVFTIGNGTNDTFDQIVICREQDSTPTAANTELLSHAVVPTTLTNGGQITLAFNAEGILHLA